MTKIFPPDAGISVQSWHECSVNNNQVMIHIRIVSEVTIYLKKTTLLSLFTPMHRFPEKYQHIILSNGCSSSTAKGT